MPFADANGIRLCYESFGSDDDPTLLLVMGLGTQMLGWHPDLCGMFVERGLRVVRFDNRDIGESTHFPELGVPDVLAMMAGTGTAPYTLADMADDTAGLLDALGVERAHLMGASLGGMVVQTTAVRCPQRVRSLTSIMSLSRREDWVSEQAALGALLAPPAASEDEYVERAVGIFRTIGSSGFPFDEDDVRERARESYRRDPDPTGTARQLAAILAPGQDLHDRLAHLDVPTLVVHGSADPLIGVQGGHGTAAAVPGAELLVVDGMGHDLPRAVWPQLVERVCALVARGESRAAA